MSDKTTRKVNHLSKKKLELLEKLEIAIETDRKWNGMSFADISSLPRAEKEEFDECRQHLNKLRDQAIKAGLHTNPLVKKEILIVLWDYILLHRGHGHWDFLRALKRGLERGVKAPHPFQKLKEKYELFEEYCRLDEKGLSDEAKRRILIGKGMIPPISRQALLKRLGDLIVELIEEHGPLDELEGQIMEELTVKCENNTRTRQPRTLGEIRDQIRKKRKFSP